MGERWIQDDVIVKVIFEVLCTFASTMSVVNAEYLKFGPLLSWNSWHLISRLDYIEDDGNPVFICLSHGTNICVGCE